MRVSPANSIALERIVPGEGLQVSGKFIPPGTNIGMSAYTVHRDAGIFGQDVEKFYPERWLGADSTARSASEMQKYFFAVSSLCRRNDSIS